MHQLEDQPTSSSNDVNIAVNGESASVRSTVSSKSPQPFEAAAVKEPSAAHTSHRQRPTSQTISPPRSARSSIVSSKSNIGSSGSEGHRFITPAGYRFGSDCNEGWESSDSSLGLPHWSRSLPVEIDATKRLTRHGNLSVPSLKATAQHEMVTKVQGLLLYRLCSTVPYLLGPISVADRIQIIIENHLETTDSPGPQLKGLATGDFDRRTGALLTILLSLQMSAEERRINGNWTAQGLAVDGNALRLYKDRRPQIAVPTRVTLQDFIDLGKQWHESPRPEQVCCDHPATQIPWAEITPKLRARNIPVSKIDKELYRRLTMKCTAENLDTALDEIETWSQNGILENRYQAWQRKEAAAAAASQPASSTPASSESGRSQGLYSKRFSHTHPLGITMADKAQMKKARQNNGDGDLEAQHFSSSSSTSNSQRDTDSTSTASDGSMKEKKKPLQKVTKAWMKFWKKTSVLARMSVILAVFGALVFGVVWTMSSKNTDFTQAAGA